MEVVITPGVGNTWRCQWTPRTAHDLPPVRRRPVEEIAGLTQGGSLVSRNWQLADVVRGGRCEADRGGLDQLAGSSRYGEARTKHGATCSRAASPAGATPLTVPGGIAKASQPGIEESRRGGTEQRILPSCHRIFGGAAVTGLYPQRGGSASWPVRVYWSAVRGDAGAGGPHRPAASQGEPVQVHPGRAAASSQWSARNAWALRAARCRRSDPTLKRGRLMAVKQRSSPEATQESQRARTQQQEGPGAKAEVALPSRAPCGALGDHPDGRRPWKYREAA